MPSQEEYIAKIFKKPVSPVNLRVHWAFHAFWLYDASINTIVASIRNCATRLRKKHASQQRIDFCKRLAKEVVGSQNKGEATDSWFAWAVLRALDEPENLWKKYFPHREDREKGIERLLEAFNTRNLVNAISHVYVFYWKEVTDMNAVAWWLEYAAEDILCWNPEKKEIAKFCLDFAKEVRKKGKQDEETSARWFVETLLRLTGWFNPRAGADEFFNWRDAKARPTAVRIPSRHVHRPETSAFQDMGRIPIVEDIFDAIEGVLGKLTGW